MTRIVARIRPPVTIRFDRGRVHTLAIRARHFPCAVHHPVAAGEAGDRSGDEVRLIGGKLSEVGDPSAADAKAEQHERHDAAGRSCERPDHTAGGKELLGPRHAAYTGLSGCETALTFGLAAHGLPC